MLFDEAGFFLHDAPWRGNFGPGSNTSLGTPGGDFTGTHGCVNIPYAAAAQLFRWAELGTPVIVS
jgi:lipoprotein-anchoring transpeptidase ErfK/SrfK